MIEQLKKVDELLGKHEEYRKQCINLIASENYSSPLVRQYQTGDFGNRYGCFETLNMSNREYTGNKYIYEFEKYLVELLQGTFSGEYVDIRPIGGHMAGMAVVTGLLEPGNTIMEVSYDDWGHGLAEAMVCNNHFQKTININYIPFNEDKTINMQKLKEIIDKNPPQLLIMGASGMIWHEPIAEVKKMLIGKDCILAYDISHISGMIVSGQYPNPLKEGADIIFGSTHKSFPGPQGGLIITNDKELALKVGNALSPCMVTSHHLQRLPALAAALLEMKCFGDEYGKAIINNSQALGEALTKAGFKVYGKNGVYSQTHQVLLDVKEFGNAEDINKKLEKADILCSGFCVPTYDIRIGTQEVTRFGFKEDDCTELAELFKRLIIDNEPIENVKICVNNFAKKLDKLQFAFN